MSFRSLTHYFIHQALAGFDAEPEAHSWESNMLRAGDERRLQAIGQRIQDLDLQTDLLTEAGHQRLEEVKALLHQARLACWKL